jgi:hypothetical protein
VKVCAWVSGTATANSNDATLIERIMFVVYCAVAAGFEDIK